MRTRLASVATAILLATSALAGTAGTALMAGYTAPLTGFATILPGQARSGSAATSGPVNNTQGYNQVQFQLLTDTSWSTYTDGRQIVFFLACSTDGGVTFPWTEGPFTFMGGTVPRKGTALLFGAYIPPSCNAFQASYAVEDASGNTGPTIDFGLAAEPFHAGN